MDPYPHYSYTGPKPAEIAREAAATGKPIEQVAAELGAPAEVAAAAAKLSEPAPPARSPSDTSATQVELEREAASTGESLEDVAVRLGVPLPVVSSAPTPSTKGRARASAGRRGGKP